MTLTLTQDQQNALDAFTRFLTDPTETVFVLSGYSGTGKTTLIKYLLELLPKFMKMARLINARLPEYTVALTATTNKAAETFSHITQHPVKTIHSHLGLRVHKDYETNSTHLVPHKGAYPQEEQLLFVDEASYIDSTLLQWIFKMTRRCKIVFIGDPAQLTPVMSGHIPVFHSHFTEAKLEKVVRQAEGNPIIDLSTKFREVVNTGQYFSFVPDGVHIQHLDRDAFNEALFKEVSRPDWKHRDSKLLAWTNKCCVDYNHWLTSQITGTPEFQAGDYAICNAYKASRHGGIKTDQLVCITRISPATSRRVPGFRVLLDYGDEFFLPALLSDKKALIKQATVCQEPEILMEIDQYWIDLRAAYACTVNKAQGSTHDRVFIDLDDIKRCTSGNQIARMLYVAVSRAREQVFLTGDLI